ncbi:MAG: hypothetical protein M3N51_07145, partial [Actinomycetota bacterium]|nr:hypothetical protein [Actinomycetota bacterium]
MRGMAALSAALAGWALAGGRLPQLPALPVLRLGLRAWLAGAGLGIGTALLGFGLTAVPAVAGSV